MAALQKLIALIFLQAIVAVSVAEASALSLDFYKAKCPDAEAIIEKVTLRYVKKVPSFAAGLLRMHFHDCFVRGCDGSVLLKSPQKDAERDAIPNLSLRGWEVIDAVKKALEKKCPGVVSCADILALSARDAVTVVHGPSWPVPLGRRDGKVSKASETISLPSPFSDITGLKENFLAQGLNVKDLVVLSGGHTLGVSRCAIVMQRLYNFTGKGDTDPSLNRKYARSLKRRCQPGGTNSLLSLDEGSTHTFDSHYFKNVFFKKGLLTSDAVLLDDAETKAYVHLQTSTNGSTFNKDFGESMVKLGEIGVLTGNQGEVRKQCAFVN